MSYKGNEVEIFNVDIKDKYVTEFFDTNHPNGKT